MEPEMKEYMRTRDNSPYKVVTSNDDSDDFDDEEDEDEDHVKEDL